MKPFSKRYSDTIDQLEALYEKEHGGCDSSTCGMSAAYSKGFSLWSIYLFDSCGAASNEFNVLMDKLPKRFKADAERERKQFIKEVSTVECPHCGAYVYEPKWVTNNGMVFCDSCAKEFPEGK